MIPSLRSVAMRSSALRACSVRAFSSECAPAQKLKCIFEEYRREHFSRETPSRFRKELIKAAVNESHANGAVQVDTLNKILVNIGRPEERLSDAELNAILVEAGDNGERIISVDKMLQLM